MRNFNTEDIQRIAIKVGYIFFIYYYLFISLKLFIYILFI